MITWYYCLEAAADVEMLQPKTQTSLAVPDGSEPPGAAAVKISRQNDRRMLADGFSTTIPASKRPPKKLTTSFHQVSSHKHLQLETSVCDEDPARLLKQTHQTPHMTNFNIAIQTTVRPLESSRHHKSLAGCESVSWTTVTYIIVSSGKRGGWVSNKFLNHKSAVPSKFLFRRWSP